MILERPFLATIHAEIDVFNKEISLGIGGDRITFDMDKKIHNFTTPIEEIYMINATFNTPSDTSSKVEETNDMHNMNSYCNQEQGRSRKEPRKLEFDINLPSMHFHPYSAATLFRGVTDWYLEPSILSEDPYEEAAQQLLEQAPRSPEYVLDLIELEDHVPVYIPEYPEDLVPAEDEAPIKAYIPKVASAPTPPLPPSFLTLRIRPPHTRASMAHKRVAVPSTYHSLLPSGTPPFQGIHVDPAKIESVKD
nr:hypothetical protein [Tanacetum cinerariifolium]